MKVDNLFSNGNQIKKTCNITMSEKWKSTYNGVWDESGHVTNMDYFVRICEDPDPLPALDREQYMRELLLRHIYHTNGRVELEKFLNGEQITIFAIDE